MQPWPPQYRHMISVPRKTSALMVMAVGSRASWSSGRQRAADALVRSEKLQEPRQRHARDRAGCYAYVQSRIYPSASRTRARALQSCSPGLSRRTRTREGKQTEQSVLRVTPRDLRTCSRPLAARNSTEMSSKTDRETVRNPGDLVRSRCSLSKPLIMAVIVVVIIFSLPSSPLPLACYSVR